MNSLPALVSALLLGGAPAAPSLPASPKAPVEKCSETDKSDCHHGAVPAAFEPAVAPEGSLIARGEKLSGAEKVSLDELLLSPAKYEGRTVLVEAKVRKACEAKGCWMELARGDGPGVRVTFKDYAFFVPTQSAGYNAKVEGEVKVATLSEERAQHYASEGAHVPRGADGKPREVQLIARGVELRK